MERKSATAALFVSNKAIGSLYWQCFSLFSPTAFHQTLRFMAYFYQAKILYLSTLAKQKLVS